MGRKLFFTTFILSVLSVCFNLECNKTYEDKLNKKEDTVFLTFRKPVAAEVTLGSAALLYLHALHGYCQRIKNLWNVVETTKSKYLSTKQRIKACDFSTFSKWHPIQSIKGYKSMRLPIVGPFIAANAMGLLYHGLVENKYRDWLTK